MGLQHMIRNSSDLLVALIGNGIRTIVTTRSTSSDAMIHYHVKEWRNVVRKWLRSAAEKKAEAALAAKEERKQLLKKRTQVPLVLGPP
jgi:hypothetical protein